MKYDSKFIRHKTNSSLRQIKNYIEKNLLSKEIINNKLEMDDLELSELYKIKFLKQMGFTLEELKIIKDNLDDNTLNSLFIIFVDKEKKLLTNLENNLHNYLLNNYVEVNRDTFGYFSSETLFKGIMYELYDLRKQWYENEETKHFIKKLRKNLYISLSLFIKENSFDSLYDNFKILNNFLKSSLENYSIIYFICLIKWWTIEPRYIKQIKNKLGFNYGPELFLKSIEFICKTN
ncbi:hypothetical protein SCORR_v1c06920 [Spiroplasma corruscae]|uniref:Uncharacterized protein n=1 Tax=Spiroplasma corruscae TaxID=216934 RepID=A0A222EQA5_9MOLU|nr:hypothetical protein [Spiroplasma corruscae]ASP28464.1 hypothetical protein SCORR_v1c06920 [Spiroplasma corruscae]